MCGPLYPRSHTVMIPRQPSPWLPVSYLLVAACQSGVASSPQLEHAGNDGGADTPDSGARAEVDRGGPDRAVEPGARLSPAPPDARDAARDPGREPATPAADSGTGTVPPLTNWNLSTAVQRQAGRDFLWGEVERFDV